jgi:hypothetical protein
MTLTLSHMTHGTAPATDITTFLAQVDNRSADVFSVHEISDAAGRHYMIIASTCSIIGKAQAAQLLDFAPLHEATIGRRASLEAVYVIAGPMAVIQFELILAQVPCKRKALALFSKFASGQYRRSFAAAHRLEVHAVRRRS